MKRNFGFILILVLMSLILVACASYEVSYINENLKNDGFTEMNYTKTIYAEETLLLEEKVKTTKEADAYKVTSTLKQISNITSDNVYTETSEESTKDLSADLSIALELKEEDFKEVKVGKTSLTGSLLDEKVAAVLGISSAKDVSVNVTLTEDLKVKEIKINYVDVISGYTINLTSVYNYN